MRFEISRRFKKCLRSLSPQQRTAVREALERLEESPIYPYYPSLRIKKMVGYADIFEGHASLGLVFTFTRDTDPDTGEIIIRLRAAGQHDIYRNP